MLNIIFTIPISSDSLGPFLTMEPKPSSSKKFIKHSLWVSYLFLAAGVALLIWLIQHVGAGLILDYLKKLGWNFIPFMAVSFLTYILFTFSWGTFLKGHRYTIKFWRLFMLKVTGEAVNTMNPLGFGGGDPVRILLMKKDIPMAESTASVVVDRTLTSIAMILFMIIGIFIAFWKFQLPPSLQWGFPISLIFMGALTYYWYKRQHEGVFQFLVQCLTKLKLKKNWSPATLEKLKEIDRYISEFYTHHKKAFYLSFFLQFVCRILGVLEIYLAAYFLDTPFSFVGAYLLASVTVIINLIFVFIPGSVGVLESSYAGIFMLMGQNPAIGTSIGILRRIRVVFWSALGLYYIYHQDRRTRLKLREMSFDTDN